MARDVDDDPLLKSLFVHYKSNFKNTIAFQINFRLVVN